MNCNLLLAKKWRAIAAYMSKDQQEPAEGKAARTHLQRQTKHSACSSPSSRSRSINHAQSHGKMSDVTARCTAGCTTSCKATKTTGCTAGCRAGFEGLVLGCISEKMPSSRVTRSELDESCLFVNLFFRFVRFCAAYAQRGKRKGADYHCRAIVQRAARHAALTARRVFAEVHAGGLRRRP